MSAKHILVVEDEAPTLTWLEKLLAAEGYRVTPVKDGASALRIARSDPPDLVVLDLLMPGLDGYAVCSMLKRDRSFRAPVVVLSGRTGAKAVNSAFDAGADAFLPKPVERQTLLAKVSELIALAAQPQPDTPP